MSSPCAARAASITAHTPGQSSLMESTHSGCTSLSHDHLSVNRAPRAKLSGVAWKSLLLLKGGSVATRSTVSESIPRRMGRLSPWYSVRLGKLRSAMLIASLMAAVIVLDRHSNRGPRLWESAGQATLEGLPTR